MKKFIIFIFTAIILAFSTSFNAEAQERINGEEYRFSEGSGVVTNFTGWVYNKNTAQWVGNENCIEIYELSSGAKAQGNMVRNLQGVQIYTFSYDGNVFYVFDVKHNGGYYKYPSIREDWVNLKKHYSFLISNEDYEKILNPSEEIMEFCLPYVNWTNGQKENEVIRSLVRVKDNAYNKKRFAIKKYNDVVRFLVDDSYGEWRYVGEWGYEDVLTKRKALNSLSDVYFETSLTEWTSLLKL